MNPEEEQASDEIAFHILRSFGYPIVVRGLKVRIDRSDNEFDILGLKLNENGLDYIDCFEVKANCYKKKKRKDLREQLRDRYDTKYFRHIYAIWDRDREIVDHGVDLGFGSLQYHYESKRHDCRIKVLRHSEDLPVVNSNEYHRFRRALNGLISHWSTQRLAPCVFLPCVGCDTGHFQYFYPFHITGWNEYPSLNKRANGHSFFCRESHDQATKYHSLSFVVNQWHDGEWKAGASLTSFRKA